MPLLRPLLRRRLGFGYGCAGSGLGQGSRGDRVEEVQFPHEEKGREKSGL